MSSKKSSTEKKDKNQGNEEERISESNSDDVVQEILDNLVEKAESIGRDSCSRLSKYFIKSGKGTKNAFSIMAYASKHRPRQPFMNFPSASQPPQTPGIGTPAPGQTGLPMDPNMTQGGPPPPPPSYYQSEMREHQDQYDPSGMSRVNTQQPRGEINLSTLPQNAPGQMVVPPNPYFNLAFWAPYPDNIPEGVPPCLAHLLNADSLFIVQQVDLIEMYMNIQEPNYYLILNTSGQCIYYAYETSDILGQICCKGNKGLQLHVKDMYHNEIIYMNKPCGCADCFCCYPIMEVYSPPLVPVGAILRTTSFAKTEFIVVDDDENKMFKIDGPLCLSVCNCVWDADFTIRALDRERTEVGVIRRENGGFIRTGFTNADYYGITFPKDLDVRVKAVFLGALFLIDYSYFEN